MIDQVWSELGPIDILVNNAGIETIVPFLELTDEQWTRLTDVNLRGNWLCSQVYCRRAVAEKRKGSIVNIGSIQAAKVLPGRTHYAPTKLGSRGADPEHVGRDDAAGHSRQLRAPRAHRHRHDRVGDEVARHPADRAGADLARPRRPAA